MSATPTTAKVATTAMLKTALMDTAGVYYLPPSEDQPGLSHTGIVFSFGRKYVHAVSFGNPMRCVELDRDVQLKPVMHNGLPYGMGRAAKIMLDSPFARTDRAASILQDVVKNNIVAVEPEETA